MSKSLSSVTFGLFLLMTALNTPAQARVAKPDDMDYAVEDRRYEVWVEKDGTYTEVIEETDKILKDSARLSRGMARLQYNPETTKLEILTAETLQGDKKIAVDPSLIEDKPLASSGEGFDQWRQALIAFPAVDVGSKVHLKYKRTFSNLPVRDFFSDSTFYGFEYELTGTYVIHSKRPLITRAYDPQKKLTVRTATHEKDYPYLLSVRLNAPILSTVIDEQDPQLDASKITHVHVATGTSWALIANPVVGQYEAILHSKLPASFEKIAKAAEEKATAVERMNTVTSRLADTIRYLGDWRTVKGQWVPRALDKIAKTQFGDCKDFAVSVAAILRSIGLDAQVAWVYRSWTPVLSPYDLPMTYRFNHAIVRVRTDNRNYWLDGTNVSSYAEGIPGDIADRKALVLNAKGPDLDTIPPQRAENYAYRFFQTLDFSPKDSVAVRGLFETGGGDAAAWISQQFNASQESVDFKVIRAAARTDSFKDWHVKGFKLTSRLVGPLRAEYGYVDTAKGFRSTAGLSYPLTTPDAVDRLLMNVDQRASELVMGEPFSYSRETIFTNLSVIGDQSLDCEGDFPWVHFSRKGSRTPAGMSIKDELVLKTPVIRHEDYKSAAFDQLQKKLVSCFKSTTITYQPIGADGVKVQP